MYLIRWTNRDPERVDMSEADAVHWAEVMTDEGESFEVLDEAGAIVAAARNAFGAFIRR